MSAAARVPHAWLQRGFWAVLDQGLFAVSNFAIGILLARWLPTEAFGAFTLAYAAFLLLGTVHTGLVTEPLLVFGGSRYAERFGSYLKAVARGHWMLSISGGTIFGLAGLLAWMGGSTVVAEALLGIGLAAPFILFTWICRRACFARLRPQLAASGGTIYLALTVAGLVLLYRWGALSVLSALLLMALSSLGAGSWIMFRLRRAVSPHVSAVAPAREILDQHWRYGRWALTASVLSWVPPNVLIFALPVAGGLEATAAFRALMNLIMPVLQAVGALAMLLLPALGRARSRAAFRELLLYAAAAFLTGSLLYWVAVGATARPLVSWLYDGRYAEHADLLWLAALLPISVSVVAVAGAALRALERPDLVMTAYVGSSVAAASAGVLAVLRWGVAGAIIGSLLASVTTAMLMLGLLYRLRSRLDRSPSISPVQRDVAPLGTRLRIAHLVIGRCNPDGANGVDRSVYHLSRAQALLGHDVALFSLSAKAPIAIDGVEIRAFAPSRAPFFLPRGLIGDLVGWSPHIVHLHSVHVPVNASLAKRLRARGIPYVITPHGGITAAGLARRSHLKRVYRRFIELELLNGAAFVHAIADEPHIRAYGVTAPLLTAPNGFDHAAIPQPLNDMVITARYPELATKRVFLFLGRLDPLHKGLDLLLESFARARATDAALLLVGPDWRGGRQQLERAVTAAGLQQQVYFWGAAHGRDKYDLLASAHVFVHPSRWEAGVPFSVMEALSCGKPCIVTRAADPLGVIIAARAGDCVEPDAMAIAEAISRYSQVTAEQLTEQGRSARQLAQREFSWTRMAETLQMGYHQVIDRESVAQPDSAPTPGGRIPHTSLSHVG